MLSALKWDIDPFLQTEIENLQTQPLEVIEKFIVKELLPRVDKELSPVLSKLITDPQQVTQVTQNLKDLIKLGSTLLLTENNKAPSTPIARTTVNIMEQINEQVDAVGQNIEEAFNYWNKAISSVSRIVKSDNIKSILPANFFPNNNASAFPNSLPVITTMVTTASMMHIDSDIMTDKDIEQRATTVLNEIEINKINTHTNDVYVPNSYNNKYSKISLKQFLSSLIILKATKQKK